MGGVGKVFKSVASFATQMASPAGLMGLAQKAFGFASKLAQASRGLSPLGFRAFDHKFLPFRGFAARAMGRAEHFLARMRGGRFRGEFTPSRPMASLHIHIAAPSGVAWR